MTVTDLAPAPRTVTTEPEFQRSSCEIKTSTRGCDVTIKVYAGSPVYTACDEALRAYFSTIDAVGQELVARGLKGLARD